MTTVLKPMPTIGLADSTTCATRKQGVIWRNQESSRVFGQVWDAPRYRPGVRREPEPGTRLRSLAQIVDATLRSVQAQLRGTLMQHASTALITRHARTQLRSDDPYLNTATVALIEPIVRAVRERLLANG